MNKNIKFLLSLPKTIYFNCKMFPLKIALQLPVLISFDTEVGGVKRGMMKFNCPSHFGMARIGFSGSDGVPAQKGYISVKGSFICGDNFRIASGGSIRVDRGAELTIGKNFFANKNVQISCEKSITIGDDVLCGWNVGFRDSDGHIIYENGGEKSNQKPVIINNHVWIASYTDVLKGAEIPINCVIAWRSIVTKKFTEHNCLLGGTPCKVIRNNVDWRRW